MRVLISAYACSPHMGSEPGMAWNWIINLSNYCDLYVITEGEFKSKIENELKLKSINNIKFYYLPISDKIRNICWDQGNWKFYWYYRKWQKRAFILAKEIIKETNIDIIHQLNMIGFHEPGYLWKINNIPKIWGPIGGLGGIPIKFFHFKHTKGYFLNLLKLVLNKFHLLEPHIFLAFRKFDFILVCNKSFYNDILFFRNKNIQIFNETAILKINNINPTYNLKFKLLWVGKNVYRKSLFLAIEIFNKLVIHNPNIELHIIGVEKIDNLHHSIYFYSKKDHNFVINFYSKCNLLLFTSLHEGTPHVVLESISCGLPVICHDKDGQADIINKNCGIKIPCINFDNSVTVFSNEINRLINDKVYYNNLLESTIKRANDLLYEKRIKELIDIYKHILND
jgi:glycosyltransferase involved in cell wall biosynthesis